MYIWMRGKSGWIRILEATIAVLIVSATMIAVYSEQSAREEISVEEFSASLQNEILDDVVSDIDLRLTVLRVVDDVPGDLNYDKLDSFVERSVPGGFDYLLRVCNLGDPNDFCKMDSITFRATMDKDIFVEETVISSELGGGAEAVYSPKKVKLFFWEGELPENFCRDQCSGSGSVVRCSNDLTQVLNRTCVLNTSSGCFEYGNVAVLDSCASNELCINNVCTFSPNSYLTCEQQVLMDSGCVSDYDDECDDYDLGRRTRNCGSWLIPKDGYKCWNILSETTACGPSPACSPGYNFVSVSPCAPSVVTPPEPPVSTVAVLSINHNNLRWDASPKPSCSAGNDRWLYYDMTISETGGAVPATLGSRQRCYSGSDGNTVCDPLRTTMPASFGGNVVPAGGSITGTNRWFCLQSGFNYVVTETFYSDGSGNNAIANYSISASV